MSQGFVCYWLSRVTKQSLEIVARFLFFHLPIIFFNFHIDISYTVINNYMFIHVQIL